MAARSRFGAAGISLDFFWNLPEVAGGGWVGWVEEEDDEEVEDEDEDDE
jgi:hypothetical protein